MQNEVTNDPASQRASADDLHDEARKIVLATAIKYGLITFVVGGILLLIGAYAAGFTISVDDPNVDGLIVMLLTVIGGAIVLGVANGRRNSPQTSSIGYARASTLRLGSRGRQKRSNQVPQVVGDQCSNHGRHLRLAESFSSSSVGDPYGKATLVNHGLLIVSGKATSEGESEGVNRKLLLPKCLEQECTVCLRQERLSVKRRLAVFVSSHDIFPSKRGTAGQPHPVDLSRYEFDSVPRHRKHHVVAVRCSNLLRDDREFFLVCIHDGQGQLVLSLSRICHDQFHFHTEQLRK